MYILLRHHVYWKPKTFNIFWLVCRNKILSLRQNSIWLIQINFCHVQIKSINKSKFHIVKQHVPNIVNFTVWINGWSCRLHVFCTITRLIEVPVIKEMSKNTKIFNAIYAGLIQLAVCAKRNFSGFCSRVHFIFRNSGWSSKRREN